MRFEELWPRMSRRMGSDRDRSQPVWRGTWRRGHSYISRVRGGSFFGFGFLSLHL